MEIRSHRTTTTWGGLSRARTEPPRSLPGQDALHLALVATLVGQINRIQRERGLELARRIGTVVLTTLFANCGESFSKGARAHVSFRSLASHPGLEMSHATLYRYTAVEVQIRRMPITIASALSLTHHVALLPVRDDARRLDLARRAVLGGWSSRKLRDQIAEERETSPRTGRPRIPPAVRATRRVVHAIEELESLDDDALRHVELEDAQQLLRGLRTIRRHLQRMGIEEE